MPPQMQLVHVKKKLYSIKGKQMRSAFSMLTAIFIIVIMSTVAMLVANLSSKSVKATTAQYQRAQAMLYAKSYTEFSILAVTAHDRATNCVQTIKGTIGNIDEGGYKIRTHIAYIADSSELGSCAGGVRQLNSTDISTDSTPLTLIIDAYVDYKDLDNTTGPVLTVHRRTVQKI